MQDKYVKASGLTESVIGAAIEVHRDKGPGLLESIYEWCLLRELELRKLSTVSQKVVEIEYKGAKNVEPLRFDLLVEDCLLIEVKAVERILPIHKAQLLSYMKLLNIPLGLLINFNTEKLVQGVSRLVLPGHGEIRGTGECRGSREMSIGSAAEDANCVGLGENDASGTARARNALAKLAGPISATSASSCSNNLA